jgi:hypothetical protein
MARLTPDTKLPLVIVPHGSAWFGLRHDIEEALAPIISRSGSASYRPLQRLPAVASG